MTRKGRVGSNPTPGAFSKRPFGMFLDLFLRIGLFLCFFVMVFFLVLLLGLSRRSAILLFSTILAVSRDQGSSALGTEHVCLVLILGLWSS